MGRRAREREPLSAAQQRLAADCLPLARSMAERYVARHRLVSQRLQDATRDAAINGLLDAADMFDPSRGLKFSNYAHHKIRSAILDSLRVEGRTHRETLSDEYLDIPTVTVSAEDEIGGRDEVDRIVRSLPTSHQPYARYAADGLTQAEISRKLGKSPTRVSRVLIEIRTMLSEEYTLAC